MKPTPEMVELARKLHDAGYRQEIQEGDWCLTGKASVAPLLWQWKDKTLPKLIPIPSLSQCLRWLDNQGYLLRLYQGTEKGELGNWIIWLKHRDSNPFKAESHIPAYADTPEETCMLSMLKILEGKNE